MAAKGNAAKENIINKLAELFGKDFIGVYDKKVYVWADDDGERVQIAIAMTCPKTFIEVAGSVVDTSDEIVFGEAPKASAAVPVMNAAPAEITQEEQDNIAALLSKLGL